ncbi:MAG: acetyl-CoA carboxylase carboxyltransferase subunit beta [Acidobacteria bacterium]|nr:MAG: acetyl-CoA carboxylase carboxyltransferase subunit beta [Acidobacteriota bacterium]
MAWFRKDKKPKTAPPGRTSQIPEGLWVKCAGCKEIIFRKEVLRRAWVCPKCGYHFQISARQRLDAILDEGWTEFDGALASTDPLKFKDRKSYRDRLREYREKTGLNDALISADGAIEGIPVFACAMEYAFMGGSMGSVVGEKVTRAAERSLTERRPLIVISTSGGARMQEGALSLMQMAKISAALARLSDAAIPYLSVLADPTTGGVTASYAMLGDVIIAEPRALIGFAGPRVIEQTIRQKLPEGFQRSEFLLEHGMVDMVVERSRLRETLARLLRLLWSEPAPAGGAGGAA